MTVKSLNTRNVKLIRKMTVMVTGLLLAGVSLFSVTSLCAAATGFNWLAPVSFNEQKLTASDGTSGQQFGRSVAISGSTIVVGVPFDSFGASSNQGSVYVFKRQGGSWVEEQKLTASDGAAGDQFGHAVAISGSTIIVTAPFDSIGANLNQGSAYVFNRQGGSWVETQKLTTSDGAADDRFGWSVAVSGSTLVVGAIGSNSLQGSVYVFNRQAGNWVEEQKLTASDGETFDQFGRSIAVSGATIVVGAVFDAVDGNTFQGSAYVFSRQGGSWVEEQKLTASDGAEGDLFSWSVAISGATIVVTAPFDTIGANFNQGSAYVFNRQGGSWVEEQKLTASDAVAFDEFGRSVAISGATIVIGAELELIGGNTAQGSAYVFNRDGRSWIETRRLTASDGADGDRFSWSLAASGSTIVVGAIGTNSFQGSAYVFEP